ncbi:hypothetical protein BH10PLA2_BH10PLA2_21460 [soil metagenome]
MSTGASAAAAHQAAIAQAIKASGVIVNLEPSEFLNMLARVKDPLVVASTGGLIWTNYSYLFSYKGLCFYTKTSESIDLPSNCEVIVAKSIWIPG